MKVTQITAAAIALTYFSFPAAAQKSVDTLRLSFSEPMQGFSYYLDPKVESVFSSDAVYDCLIAWNEQTGQFEPLLAKSWVRVNDTTLEFDLREDVKWHDGKPFTADDVVYTFAYLRDPKSRLRFAHFWAWIKTVEKIGPFKVRLITERPTPFDLAQLAFQTYMLPAHAHGAAESKVLFSQKPIGTGMYRVVSFDQKTGANLELNKDYRHGGKAKPPSNIGKIFIRSIPDTGTRVAEFLAGQLDMLPSNTPLDQLEGLVTQPGVELAAAAGNGYLYLALDAKGRSGQKALTDARVRLAIMKAIDREALTRLITGNRPQIERPQAMCWKFQAGCDYSIPLPAYDPEGARKLLKEAGYENGFQTNITSFASETYVTVAQAVSGELRKIGIIADVEPLPLAAYRQKQAKGRIEIFSSAWPAGGLPDVSQTMTFLYAPPPATDYHGDEELKALARKSLTIMDPNERRKIGKQIFDMGTQRAYFMPLTPSAILAVHRSELSVRPSRVASYGLRTTGLRWK